MTEAEALCHTNAAPENIQELLNKLNANPNKETDYNDAL